MFTTRNGELFAGEIPISQLVARFGEPLYIYDAEVITRQYERLREALPDRFEIFYSMKANPNLSVVACLEPLTNGLEVSSLRELYVGQRAGFSPDRMIFVGPSKSREELRAAISAGIFVVVESEQELMLIDRLAADAGRTVDVALRINPAFDSAGSKLKMGGTAGQFGIDEELIEPVIQRAKQLTAARLQGIHAYLGTRILNHEVAARNTQQVLELARRLQDATGLDMRFIDVGGGLGIAYFADEHDFEIDRFRDEVAAFFPPYEAAFPRARFAMESGRFLVADAGIYVTRVRYVKESRGTRIVLTSGGMNHHQATTSLGALVKTHFPMEIVNRMSAEKMQDVRVCGPLCTPADVLGKKVRMVDVQPGDLLGVLRSGAYGLTASPFRFLSHDHPAEVLVYGDEAFLIRSFSSVEQILDNQVLVSAETYRPRGARREPAELLMGGD